MRSFGFGQVLDSDRAIAGTIPAPDAAAPTGIAIRHHPPAPAAPAPIYTPGADGLVFAAPLVGSYRCRPDAIDVTPHPDADPAVVAALLIATALPAVLWLQGCYVLHAAAVRLPGHDAAIALAGPSGIGKSTIAADVLARGGDLVADDSIALRGSVHASGLPGGLFEPIDAARRRFVPVPCGRGLAGASLAAIFVLSRPASDADAQGACVRLDPLAAVQALLQHRHRPRVPDCLGRQRETLASCALSSAAIPVYAWPRRAGSIRLDEQEWTMLAAASQRKGDV